MGRLTGAQQTAMYHARRARRQRILGRQIQDTSPSNLFFTAGRLRLPTSRGTVEAGEEFTAHKSMWISDDFPQNYFYIGLWNGYTDNTGAEQINVTSYDLVGASMHAFYGGTWKIVTLISVALANPVTFAAGAMRLIGPFVFPDWVPAESQMAVVLRINTTAGAFLPTSIKLRNGTNEGASRTVVGSDFHLTATGALGGTDGRFDGEVMAPAFVLARPQNKLDRPVFLIDGDSIVWGKNSNENNLPGTTYGSMGAMSLAMDSKTGKRRYPFSNWGCPGMGPDDDHSYKDALIRLCPNRPFTHVVTNHINNVGGAQNVFEGQIIDHMEKLDVMSRYWGDVAAPIFHAGILPKPGTTNWCTDSVNQTGSGQSYPTAPRYVFGDKLKAGTVPYCDGVFKTDRILENPATQRGKWALTGFSTTIQTNYVSGATSIILNANPGVGSMIVCDPGGVNAARHVTAVTGSGPYTCTIESGITSSALLVGVTVKTTYVGDTGSTGGTHPATPGHVQLSLDYAEELASRFA